ncbi:MAG: type II secretion system F family protein [Armatimonadaceae bacterium]
MPAFTFTATASDGKSVTNTSEAVSVSELRQRLSQQGYTVKEIKPAKEKGLKTNMAVPMPAFLERFQKVKLTELSIFCRQFSTMIDAGVSLVRCLDVLGEQNSSPKLKKIIVDLKLEVEAGNMLSKAMSKYPGTFSNLFIGLIRAGEVGGVLEESLQRLSTFLEKDVELRRKVKAALTYPVLVSVVALGIVMFPTIFIVPQFLKMFIDLGLKAEDFPAMTMSLKVFSDFMVYKFYYVAMIVGALWFACKLFGRTKVGHRFFDLVKLKIPVFGKLNHKVALARFSRTLATLLSSGVPILQALETVAGTVSNDVLSDAILDARARVREGDTISEPLYKSKMFPPMVIQMISIGQEAGSLDTMLSKIADFYDGEVDAAIASLTAAIEPLLIVFLGVTVGYIVIAMFLPLVGLIQGLSGGGGDEE